MNCLQFIIQLFLDRFHILVHITNVLVHTRLDNKHINVKWLRLVERLAKVLQPRLDCLR
jgi:hypothetical protein